MNPTLPLAKPELYACSPHQSPMLLLDRVLSYQEAPPSLEAELDVGPGSVFFDPARQLIPGWIGFEYIAQSIAVLAGLIQRVRGEEPRLGFIMGVRDFETFSEGFRLGDKVSVRIRQVFREGPVAVFEGDVLVKEQLAARGILNTIEADSETLKKMGRSEP